MSDEAINNTTDDQSHYEISLTAGQAFIAFVLLLLSLAASFAFGLVIGRGQGEDRLVVKKEPAVITEASALKPRNDGRIVELGADDFKPKTDTTVTTTAPPAITESAPPPTSTVVEATASQPAQTPAPAGQAPVYAQLLVSTDQHTAETLAATLIDKGFPTAYVERAGGQFKVRVKFNSEADARAAEPKLKEFAKDVWIVK
jgi:hypothetical protein